MCRRSLATEVKIFIVGAGLIGERILSGLHEGHDVTVVDLDPARLKPLAQHYDVATAQGNAASGRDLLRAGLRSRAGDLLHIT